MKKLEFKTTINAPKEKVWKTLWDDKTYRQWTSVFTPESHAISDWKEGSNVDFMDGKGNGMRALIQKKTDNSVMVFKHVSELKNGEETKLPEAGFESYYLTDANGKTELRAELDAPEDFEKYFSDVFPKALDAVKKISEA